MTLMNPLDLMQDRPDNPSEDVRYGRVMDPAQFQDPKRLGRVKVRVPELHGEEGSGIPTEHLPWTQMERHQSFGGQTEMSHFRMPQRDAHVKARFHGDDTYSILGSGAPYSQPANITEVNVENQHLRDHDKDPLGNFDHTNMENRSIKTDKTQMNGPHNHRKRGDTTFFYTTQNSQTPGTDFLNQGGQQGGGGGGAGGGQQGGGAQPAALGQGSSIYRCLSDKEEYFAVVRAPQSAGNSMQADDRNLPMQAFIHIETDKITVQVNNQGSGQQAGQAATQAIFTRNDVTVNVKDNNQTKTSAKLTKQDIKLTVNDSGGQPKSEITMNEQQIKIKATLIILDGMVSMGGAGAGMGV